MLSFERVLQELKAQGYSVPKARTKIAHDIVLKAMSLSGMTKNVTVKGGVVMSDLTGDVRRATMDMDVDFIRYSLSNEKVEEFVAKLNCLVGVKISRIGEIVELRQRNYRGKRIFLIAEDSSGVKVRTKVDIGVHVYGALRQKLRTFALSTDADGARLTANSPEQIFCEKLKSLLRFGARSERPKDLFDMCYLTDSVNKSRLLEYMSILIFADAEMREKTIGDVLTRLERTFASRAYLHKLARTDVNWLSTTPKSAVAKILGYFRSLG